VLEQGPELGRGRLYIQLALVAFFALDTDAGLAWSGRAMDIGESTANETLWAAAASLHGFSCSAEVEWHKL